MCVNQEKIKCIMIFLSWNYAKQFYIKVLQDTPYGWVASSPGQRELSCLDMGEVLATHKYFVVFNHMLFYAVIPIYSHKYDI